MLLSDEQKDKLARWPQYEFNRHEVDEIINDTAELTARWFLSPCDKHYRKCADEDGAIQKYIYNTRCECPECRQQLKKEIINQE